MQDLIVVADRIHVLGTQAPVRAVLVRGGRVAAVGNEEEVRAAALPGYATERLDGATVTPGLTDAHVHLTLWALARRRVDLNAARTLEDGVAAVAAACGSGEGWVRGLGWDVHRWGRFPTRHDLDAVCPERPCYLESHDIHAAWLNSAGLRACGITRDTPDPEGGTIGRDERGEPNGLLFENAKWLVESRLPVPAPTEVRDALLDAQRAAHGLGLTGVHSVEATGIEDFAAMQEDDVLRLRVLQSFPLTRLDAAIQVGLRSGFGGEWVRMGGVKMFLDGALGSRTAWLRAPYEGTRDDFGIQTLPADEFRDTVRRAAAAGIASTVHAIGDAAVELAIDVMGSVPPPRSMPHRIEHLQLCPPDLWERAARSGIVGSMQPVHLMTDIAAAERHWGHERSRGAYPMAALQRAGVVLAFGSDVPVETADPRPGLFAAVARRGWDGGPEGGWFPEHALSAEAALRGYTEGPAFAAGVSGRRGRLLPGYDADLVAWDRDPLAAEPDDLLTMRCVLTMVGGETVHRV